MRQPLNEIAVRAVAELLGAIRNGRSEGFRIELPARLVVRDSTGPAPKGRRRAPHGRDDIVTIPISPKLPSAS
ncbi:MAG: hypothetical protein JF619_12330 [Massilia sp.]|nr:hypothetical protein [Massilia sp.]